MSSYSGSAGGAGLTGSGVPELLLWQYVVQLTAALRYTVIRDSSAGQIYNWELLCFFYRSRCLGE